MSSTFAGASYYYRRRGIGHLMHGTFLSVPSIELVGLCTLSATHCFTGCVQLKGAALSGMRKRAAVLNN
eukprot:9487640-Pyramimonas_sp.AAC.1